MNSRYPSENNDGKSACLLIVHSQVGAYFNPLPNDDDRLHQQDLFPPNSYIKEWTVDSSCGEIFQRKKKIYKTTVIESPNNMNNSNNKFFLSYLIPPI